MSADVCVVGIDRFIVVICVGEEEKEGSAKVTIHVPMGIKGGVWLGMIYARSVFFW